MSVTNTQAGSIVDRFVGLSYEKDTVRKGLWFTSSNSNMIALYRQLGPGILRLGANSADVYTWNASGPGGVVGQVAPADIDSLAGFLRATGWKVIYGVNLASNLPNNTADEVAYAVNALGSNLAGIEVGNEPDLYARHRSGYANWNYQAYQARWQTFYNAILARTSSAPIMGPATAGYASTWTIPFAQDKAAEIVGITQHYYRGNALSPTSNIASLLSYDSRLDTECHGLYAAASKAGVPLRITETNSYYNFGPDGVVDSFASALWIIDHFFHLAALGVAGANVHGGGDNPYTPIWDVGGVVTIVRPLYYGMRFFTMLGQGKVYACKLSVNGLNATAYAVVSASGAMSLMLVNKDPYQSINLSIDCGRSIATANMMTLAGPALSGTSGLAIQGGRIQLDGSLAAKPAYTLAVNDTTVQCYLNAKSAALITLS